MNETLIMILRMSLATVLYVLATALVWRFWQKREKTMALKVAIGIFYGLCCVASNHLGVQYEVMLLNVRDIGPLAAGLFFSPISGIISGLIGGIERFLIGEYLSIGAYTRVACGLSTGLAGFLAAMLYKWVYEGKRPSIIHSFMVGAVMEVFHMYAVLVSNGRDIYGAFFVVQRCSIPMIIFTAVGLALCSMVVFRLSHEYRQKRRFDGPEKTPVFVHFQRGLVVVILLLFTFSTWVGYTIQFQISQADASNELAIREYELKTALEEADGDFEALQDWMHAKYNISDNYSTILIDRVEKKCIWGISAEEGPANVEQLGEADEKTFEEHVDQMPFFAKLDIVLGSEIYGTVMSLDERYLASVFCMSGNLRRSSEVQTYETLFSNILIFSSIYLLVSVLVENIVVRNLGRVNRSLKKITAGQLDEVVYVRSSLEFSELSDDINQTVDTLKGYIEEAKRRMEKDLKLAAAIQEAALPKDFTFKRDDFRIFALMDPAKEVGGDFYDFFFTDNDTMVLVIADVSGKSVPAALFMMRAKTAIKNFARSSNGPAELLANVNNTLCEGNDAEMFVTVWLGIIDLKTGKMTCANAGHEYPVLMRAGGEYELVKDKHGMVLAAMEGVPMKEYELDLHPGDRLFVYTDGVPEAINEKEKAYGTERLVNTLNTLTQASEEATLRDVLLDVEAFAGKAEQFDDITMLGFTYLGQ